MRMKHQLDTALEGVLAARERTNKKILIERMIKTITLAMIKMRERKESITRKLDIRYWKLFFVIPSEVSRPTRNLLLCENMNPDPSSLRLARDDN
jgi:hypothetical protein